MKGRMVNALFSVQTRCPACNRHSKLAAEILRSDSVWRSADSRQSNYVTLCNNAVASKTPRVKQ